MTYPRTEPSDTFSTVSRMNGASDASKEKAHTFMRLLNQIKYEVTPDGGLLGKSELDGTILTIRWDSNGYTTGLHYYSLS